MANTNYPSAGTPNENRSASSNTTRNVLIGLLAVGLLGTWGYVLYDKNKTTEQIQVKSAEVKNVSTDRDSIKNLYEEAIVRLDNLTGENTRISSEVVSKDAELKKIKTEIKGILANKNATAADLRRARSLIGDLNGKIGNLEQEVARLMGENQQLATNNTVLTQEKTQLQTDLQTTTQVKEDLAKKVDVGSTFAASNITIKGIDEKGNGKEKETDKAKKVNKLVVAFDVENRIAPSGPVDLYVIVTAPDGQVISNPAMSSGTLTTRNEGDRPFTYKSTVDYEQGTRKNVAVPLHQDKFQVGDYKIEIYQNGFKIAEGTRNLRKGGLFG
jgi:predicted nuclease with TOPRIM domain